jgi:aryl-alcohol dehydrogenase-like predicted oxidoreductase/cyclophilin family peptidyl-prolyl cis-trans isomerase
MIFILYVITLFSHIIMPVSSYTGSQYTVVMELDHFGSIAMTTVPTDAFPRATHTFLSNVRRRMYDGCVFYRSEFFVLQGGECVHWDEEDRPPHVLHNYNNDSPVTPVSPPEWNAEYPHVAGSVALAGDPASMHFFINLIDRREWSNQFQDGVRSEPVVGHIVQGIDIIQAISSTSKVTDTHKIFGQVHGMNFLDTPIHIRHAFVLEDEMNKATQTFLVSFTTRYGKIVMRTVPSNPKSVKMFIHNCQHYYANPPGGCTFYRSEKGKLLMAGECAQPHVPVTSETFAPEFDQDWPNIAGSVTLTGEDTTSEFFFINDGNNSDWIKRAVVAHVEEGWTVVRNILALPTQTTHPTTKLDLKMVFLTQAIGIEKCEVRPFLTEQHPILSYMNNRRSQLLGGFAAPMPAMVFKRLGATELQASILGLGAHNFGDPQKVGNLEKVVVLVQNALRVGINLIDTADCYPCFASTGACIGKQSEILIGHALQQLKTQDHTFERDSLIIMSKIYDDRSNLPNSRGLSRKHIIRGCYQALARLQLTYLDVFLAHADDPSISMDSIVTAFGFLIAQGKILHWGVSNWNLDRLELAVHTAHRLGVPPPMVDQTIAGGDRFEERKLLCQKYDIGLVLFGARHLNGFPNTTPYEIRLLAASKVEQLLDTVQVTVAALGKHM